MHAGQVPVPSSLFHPKWKAAVPLWLFWHRRQVPSIIGCTLYTLSSASLPKVLSTAEELTQGQGFLGTLVDPREWVCGSQGL